MNKQQVLLKEIRRADEDFHLFENGDRVIVGISGGKDSSALLSCLIRYSQFEGKDFDIIPVFIDAGFSDISSFLPLFDHYKAQNIEVRVYPTQIYDILKEHKKGENGISCSLCARLRKGALINAARKFHCNKIALGHHNSDAVETLFMNMINTARVATFSPNQYLDDCDMHIIRPLIYADEKDIISYVKEQAIPIVKNACPNDHSSQRSEMRVLLNEIYSQYPQAKKNFKGMLTNTDKVELLDKR